MDLNDKLEILCMENECLTKELIAWEGLKENTFNQITLKKNAELVDEYLQLTQKVHDCKLRLIDSLQKYEDFIRLHDKNNTISKYPLNLITLAYSSNVPEELQALVGTIRSDLGIAIGFEIDTKKSDKKPTQLGE